MKEPKRISFFVQRRGQAMVEFCYIAFVLTFGMMVAYNSLQSLTHIAKAQQTAQTVIRQIIYLTCDKSSSEPHASCVAKATPIVGRAVAAMYPEIPSCRAMPADQSLYPTSCVSVNGGGMASAPIKVQVSLKGPTTYGSLSKVRVWQASVSIDIAAALFRSSRSGDVPFLPTVTRTAIGLKEERLQ